MKNPLLLIVSLVCLFTAVHSQSPGIIVRPAGGNGATPLNPNGDGFTSATTAGFLNSDITESEILYKIIAPPFPEPVSDLLRGPATLYSDLVRQLDGSGFYVFNDGTNMLFRLRLGNIVSGSKGYSILIDTDGKFGNTGPYADTNYRAATTGVNGNPGFELEVVLETNFRVALYNVDGTHTPTLISSYPVNTHSQISVALSTVTNTPDYFYDFYVPISAMGITPSTPLRMVATTVMAPAPAIGGPKSDIYGVDDAAIKDPSKSWDLVISNQPTFTTSSISSGGSGPGNICTAAPVLSGPIQAGTVTVSGTWSPLDGTRPSSATITLYKNGSSIATTTATGGAWSIPGITVSSGDVLYAQAQAAGESQCLQSNHIKVITCSAVNMTTSAGLAFTCSGTKGMEGTMPSGTKVKIYQVTTSGVTLVADDATTLYKVLYSSATAWRYDGEFGQGAPSSCSGGTNDVPNGTYYITATETGKCESNGVFTCVNATATAIPVITQTNLYNGGTTVSGTAVSGASVKLYRNSKLEASTTATGGNYSFTGLAYVTGDTITVSAQGAGLCISASVSRIVTCFTTPPIINTDNNGNLSNNVSTISGRSGEPAGTIVTVLENGVSIGTPTVQLDGTWSLNYTPIASRSYTATQRNGTCAASTASAAAVALAATTVCPTITGSYTSTANTVSGTLPAAFTGTVRVYLDGVNIGSVSVTAATTWSIPANTSYSNTLYPGGVLTCTSQATGGAEKTDCASSATISCASPAAPLISPLSSSIKVGQWVDFSVSNSITGIMYSITDVPVGITNYGTSQFGNNASLSLPTYTFGTAGSYDVLVKAISLDGPGCLSSTAASITVNPVTLPVKLLYFKGAYVNGIAQLQWATSQEQNSDHFTVERSDDGTQFAEVGRMAAAGNSNSIQQYSFADRQPIGASAWYRLQMTDKDGRNITSQVVRLMNTNRALQVLSVSPNPFESDLQLAIQSDRSKNVSIQLMDMEGRIVYRADKLLTGGNNKVMLSSLSKLSKGMYVLRVMEKAEVLFMQRVNKIH